MNDAPACLQMLHLPCIPVCWGLLPCIDFHFYANYNSWRRPRQRCWWHKMQPTSAREVYFLVLCYVVNHYQLHIQPWLSRVHWFLHTHKRVRTCMHTRAHVHARTHTHTHNVSDKTSKWPKVAHTLNNNQVNSNNVFNGSGYVSACVCGHAQVCASAYAHVSGRKTERGCVCVCVCVCVRERERERERERVQVLMSMSQCHMSCCCINVKHIPVLP